MRRFFVPEWAPLWCIAGLLCVPAALSQTMAQCSNATVRGNYGYVATQTVMSSSSTTGTGTTGTGTTGTGTTGTGTTGTGGSTGTGTMATGTTGTGTTGTAT